VWSRNDNWTTLPHISRRVAALHIIHSDIISPVTTTPCTQHSLNTYAHAHGQ
jgi:hypothetical protein